MKTQTKQKSRFRGFYTALFLSLLMIGAACVFAYRQTSQTLEQNLNSLNEQMELTEAESETEPYEAPVVGGQTDVAKPAETTARRQPPQHRQQKQQPPQQKQFRKQLRRRKHRYTS